VKIEDTSRAEYGVGCFIKPYQQPHPPIAISIKSPSSGSARMAGKQGWIPISGAAFLHPRYTASHWEAYAEGCEKAGRPADPDIWRVARSIIVAPSDQEARDYVLNPEGPFGELTAMAHEWDLEFGKRTMTLLAEEVMPALSQHADATRVASAAG
jgi:alkanesulfonate monooxygenase SsuD/methylene tetrahydromethanopterin reductase-like flavin-dependent oxidoreductase (luciferase family)